MYKTLITRVTSSNHLSSQSTWILGSMDSKYISPLSLVWRFVEWISCVVVVSTYLFILSFIGGWVSRSDITPNYTSSYLHLR